MADFDNIIRLFASISLIIGAVECFAGFKIMKAMMAIWAFFIGAVPGVIIGVLSALFVKYLFDFVFPKPLDEDNGEDINE